MTVLALCCGLACGILLGFLVSLPEREHLRLCALEAERRYTDHLQAARYELAEAVQRASQGAPVAGGSQAVEMRVAPDPEVRAMEAMREETVQALAAQLQATAAEQGITMTTAQAMDDARTLIEQL